MTDKELHKLSRKELLEIMLRQQKEIELLRADLKKAEALLKSRKMLMKKAGSIAEASLRINEVFEAAQKAADMYLMSVKASSERGKLAESGAESLEAEEDAPAAERGEDPQEEEVQHEEA